MTVVTVICIVHDLRRLPCGSSPQSYSVETSSSTMATFSLFEGQSADRTVLADWHGLR